MKYIDRNRQEIGIMSSGRKEGITDGEGGGVRGKKEKERNGSLKNINELWKRKREISEKSGKEKREAFKRSKW